VPGNAIGMFVMQMKRLIFQLVRILIIVQAILFNMFLMKVLNQRTLKALMMKRGNMMVINPFINLIVMKIIKM
jgi:hypothetical protein